MHIVHYSYVYSSILKRKMGKGPKNKGVRQGAEFQEQA
jgi:hypothetical protein